MHAISPTVALLDLSSVVCRFQSFRCFCTITTVFLFDLAAKLLQAGEQRGLVLREEDGWLELHPSLMHLGSHHGAREPNCAS